VTTRVPTLGRADPDATAAPSGPLAVAVERFDRAVDGAFDRIRGVPAVDSAAAVVSNLADYGFVWSVVASVQGRRRGPRRRRARRALTVAGVTSAGVNAALKAVVGRRRPDGALRIGRDDGVPVRAPSSSSFPSGHTLASFCTAVLLAETPAQTVVFLTFSSAVAASRIHLRAHHPSDVVGGAVIGVAVGSLARVVLRAP